jgi:hypothetical protein
MRLLCKLGIHKYEWSDYEWSNVFSHAGFKRWGFRNRYVITVWLQTHTRQKCAECGAIKNHISTIKQEGTV